MTTILELMQGIMNQLKNNEFDAVTNYLRNLSPPSMTSEEMVTVLRTTFPVRFMLDGEWEGFYGKVKDEIKTRGLESQVNLNFVTLPPNNLNVREQEHW